MEKYSVGRGSMLVGEYEKDHGYRIGQGGNYLDFRKAEMPFLYDGLEEESGDKTSYASDGEGLPVDKFNKDTGQAP